MKKLYFISLSKLPIGLELPENIYFFGRLLNSIAAFNLFIILVSVIMPEEFETSEKCFQMFLKCENGNELNMK